MKRILAICFMFIITFTLIGCNSKSDGKFNVLKPDPITDGNKFTSDLEEHCFITILDNENNKKIVDAKILQKDSNNNPLEVEYNGKIYVSTSENKEIIWKIKEGK